MTDFNDPEYHTPPSRPLRDYGLEAHQEAEKHLSACWEAYFDEEQDGLSDVEWPETAGPFCGCDTCIVREVLHAAYPILREGILAEQAPKMSDCPSPLGTVCKDPACPLHFGRVR